MDNQRTYYNNLFFQTSIQNYYEICRKRKLAALGICVYLDIKRKKYPEKRYAVAPIFQHRKTSGFVAAVLPSFVLEDLRFHNYFRMSATQLENLLILIGSDIVKQHHIKEAISVTERVMLTVRFLASGDSIHSMSYQYLVGVTTASNIISETCESIWKNLKCIVLMTELSHANWKKKADCFSSRWNFPNCIGAIDGKHIVMQCPPLSGSSYYNYKGSFSIVLLAICDANYIFTFVDIGAYGRRSDGGIFSESEMGIKLNNGEMNLPPDAPVCESGVKLPYCIVGDEAFPLKPYLMRPYPGKQSVEHDKRVFNFRLGRSRRTIENAFGILVSKWRIFRRPINMSVKNTMLVVQASICLHNWLRMADVEEENNVQYITSSMVDREDSGGFIPGSWRTESSQFNAFNDLRRVGSNTSTKQAIKIREAYTDYFNNEGALDWQEYL